MVCAGRGYEVAGRPSIAAHSNKIRKAAMKFRVWSFRLRFARALDKIADRDGLVIAPVLSPEFDE